MSLAYAIDLADPDGAALLAGDLSRRHDFGLAHRDGKVRARQPWAVPHPRVAAAVPWHVSGSLLGLDVVLASVNLRRLSTDRMLDEPAVTAGARAVFAASQAMLDPLRLDDAARDRIASAIDRGLQRVAGIGEDRERFEALASEVRMDGWRRRAAVWSVAHDREAIDRMFSLSELLVLGDAAAAGDLHMWGMFSLSVTGCPCASLVPAWSWPLLAGRYESGALAASVADLHLHVARTLARLDVPAPITKHVLAAAIQDFVDEVRPNDANDWLTLVRGAQSVSRERVEDYVATAAAGGPLVPLRKARQETK
jgi:hypothetical protein